MYAKMIRRQIDKLKEEAGNLRSKSIDMAIENILYKKCHKIRIQFRYDDGKLETDVFGVDRGVKCPHGKTEKSACSNCSNFVIHNFELEHNKTLVPYTSTCTAYCAKQKYRGM